MSNTFFHIFPHENFIDLGMYQYGYEQCDPGHSFGPVARNHYLFFGPVARNHYLFHYVISGTGTLMADDSKGITQTYSIKSGQGFLIFPGQITTYYADEKLPWEYVWIEFDGLKVKEILHIKSGQGFLIFPVQITTYYADEKLPLEYVWIEFDGLKVKEILQMTKLSPDTPVYRSHSKDLKEQLRNEMLYIVHNAEESPFHMIGHLYLFLDLLMKNFHWNMSGLSLMD